MDYSIQNINGLLIRSKLLTPDEVRAMSERWQREGKAKQNSTPHYLKWIVANKYLTEYQASLISRGHADDFFLNQYKILDKLGKGRMAGVYKAVHRLGQVVAIKVLPPSRVKDHLMLGRFRREARLAMQLKHPNVVRSFQVGEAKGLHYLVMEYLEGESLEEVLKRRKKLPVNEAVRLLYQALQGLQHIHEKGFVHRDLKPANLMLISSPQEGEPDTTIMSTVKILDIGLGRELFEESAQAAAKELELTGEGVLLGTPDYLAPEQARDPRSIDIRADIYSLGCVLYHCLAGQPPFPDKNVLNQMVRHATETPKPVKEFTPHVPDGLQQVLNWMLTKEPAKRYPTPERAAQALQIFLVAGAPARPIEEAPKMRQFLTWLEIGDKENGEKEAKAPSAPKAVPVSAQPVPETGANAASPTKEKSRKHKKRHRKKSDADKSAPPAPLPVSNQEIDVELVPASFPTEAVQSLPEKKRLLALSQRDWLLVGVGAGAVIGAVFIGWALAQIF